MKKILLIILIFIFSISLRLWNLNSMGRTFDESAQIELGYKIILIIKEKKFNDPLLSYPYHPPLTKYLYGWAGQYDLLGYRENGDPIFRYDWINARIISVFFSSLTVVFIVLIGWQYISPFVGIISGIIFSSVPFFLGLSQIASIESVLIFFFTASIYSFLNFLKKQSFINASIAGVLIGLAFETKYTNILLVPLIILIYSIWYFYKNKKKNNYFNLKVIYIFLISFFMFFVLWPMPWFHLKEVIQANYQMRIVDTSHSIPEVFFGRLMLVPKIYYVVHFLITTPILLLILFIVGFKTVSFKKNWILYVLAVWFLFPFIQSLYNFRQHGVRYIIEIYAPFALISAIGFDHLVSKISKRIWLKFVFFVPVIIYMLAVLIRITPYYLDYFNILVGGTKNVYEKRLFQLGWWGQGMREAGLYIQKNVASGSQVAVVGGNSFSVMPSINNVSVTKYEEDRRYDYIVVSYFQVIREGFNDIKIKNSYSPVYNVLADGAPLVTIYRQRQWDIY